MWTKDVAEFNAPENVEAWLSKPYYLAGNIKRLTGDITIDVIEQDISHCFEDEQVCLGLPQDTNDPESICFIRRVFLASHYEPLVYGRVIAPKDTYLKNMEAFNNLGGRALGNTLLYSDPKTTRSDFEYCAIDNSNEVYKELMSALPESYDPPKFFYGRRSVFQMGGVYPLLVAEFFLDGLPEYVEG